jgi:ABC-type lipoprotein release transport system permease subunit
MKNSKKDNGIHRNEIREEKKPKAQNFEEIKKELLSDKLVDEETVNLGINRGQFFIRIPNRMANRLSLTKEDKIKLILEGKDTNKEIKLEVIKNANSPT